MNKKIKNLLLMGAAFAGLVGVAVSCQDYDSDLKAINDRIDQLADVKIKPIEEQITSINNSIKSLKEMDETLDASIKGVKSDLDATKKELADTKTALQNAKTELEGKINAAKAALESEISDLNTEISALKTRVAELEKKAKDLAASVADHENRIAALEEARTSIENRVTAIEALLPTYLTKTEAEATYATKTFVQGVIDDLAKVTTRVAALEAYDKVLDGKINDINESLKNYATKNELKEVKDLAEKTEKALNDLVASLDAKIDGKITEALKAYYTAEQVKTLLESYYTKTQIDDLFKTVNGDIDALEAAIGDLSAFSADEDGNVTVADQLKKLWSSLNDQKMELDEAIDNVEKASIERDEKLQDAVKELNNAIDDINAEINTIWSAIRGIQVDVEALINKVQSIAYVPTHRDHKARVSFLTTDSPSIFPWGTLRWTFVAPGTVTMTYQVQPVEAVADIVDAWTATPEILSYYTVEVKGGEAVPALKIQSVTADANDRLVVVARPESFKEDFWPTWASNNTDVSYSVALKLENAVKTHVATPYDEEEEVEEEGDGRVESNVKNNLTSEFVNLVPGDRHVVSCIELVKDNKTLFNGQYEEQFTVEYNDTETSFTLLDGYVPMFRIDNVPVSLEDAEYEYGLTLAPEACAHSTWVKKESKFTPNATAEQVAAANFKVVSEDVDHCVVSLVKEDKTSLYNRLTTAHKYVSVPVGVEATFYSTVLITKPKAKVEIAQTTLYWEYKGYREVECEKDANGFYHNIPEVRTPYEGIKRLAYATAEVTGLPQDVTFLNLAGDKYTIISTEIKEFVNGEAVDAEGVSVSLDKNIYLEGESLDELPEGCEHQGEFGIWWEGYKFGHVSENTPAAKKYEAKIVADYADITVEYTVSLEAIGLPKSIAHDFGTQAVKYTKLTNTADATAAPAVEMITGKPYVEDAVQVLFDELPSAPYFNGVEGLTPVQAFKQFAYELKLPVNSNYSNTAGVLSGTNYKANRGEEAITNLNATLGNTDIKKTHLNTGHNTKPEEVKPVIVKTDVKTVDDVFGYTTTIKTYEGMEIVYTAKATVEMPKFVVVQSKGYSTTAKDNKELDIQARAQYDPNNLYASQLKSFSLSNMNLQSAFTVLLADEEGNLAPVADLADENLTLTFEIVETPKSEGIYIHEDGFHMSYVGFDEKVKIEGTLKIDGIVLPKTVASYAEYVDAKYNVQDLFEEIYVTRFRPFGPFEGGNETLYIADLRKNPYSKFTFPLLSLKDKRTVAVEEGGYKEVTGWNVINTTNTASITNPWAPASSNGFLGQGAVNTGFANRAGQVYSLGTISFGDPQIVYIDENKNVVAGNAEFELRNFVNFTKNDGMISFNTDNQIELSSDVRITIPVTVEGCPWLSPEESQAQVVYIIKK